MAEQSNAPASVQTDRETIPRVRRWAPRSKTGCSTCRQRRIKCDETKPLCKKCFTSGFQCPGYWHDRSPAPPCQVVLLKPRCTFEENLASESFRLESIDRLSGQEDANAFLRSLVHYPALWHASLAIGSMHKRLQLQVQDRVANAAKIAQLKTLALSQYSKSVGLLLQALQQTDFEGHLMQEMVLLASIMYSLLSNITGNAKDARVHGINSLNMFDQWKFWQRLDERLPRGVVPPRMIASHIMCFEGRMISVPSAVCHLKGLQDMVTNNGMVTGDYVAPFRGIVDACIEFHPLVANVLVPACVQLTNSNLLHRGQSVMSSASHEAHAHWKAKLQRLLDDRDCGRVEIAPGEMSMLRHLQATSMTLDIISELNHVTKSWGPYDARCVEVLNIYTFIVESGHRLPRPRHDSFRLLIRSCYTLWIIARSTQNLEIRERAMGLIRQWPPGKDQSVETNPIPVLEAIAQQDWASSVEMDNGDTSRCGCLANRYVCGQHRVVAERLEMEEGFRLKVMLQTAEDVIEDRPCRVVYKESWTISTPAKANV